MSAVQVYAIGNPFGLDHTLTQVKHSAHMCMTDALFVDPTLMPFKCVAMH